MKRSWIVSGLGIAALIGSSACSSPVESSESNSAASQEELRAKKPAPFALQLVGSYTNHGDGELANVSLDRAGRYVATFVDGSVERGSYRATPARVASGPNAGMPTLPVAFTFTPRSTSGAWTASFDSYASSALVVSIDGETDTVTADSTVGPNEGACDDSGGTWSDDEADPKTGLFCTCPSGLSYIPSEGGCVQ